MPAISSFGGIFPRLAEHNLPANAATVAHDVKLRNGKIEAWRERNPMQEVGANDVSFFLHGCCVYSWETCVHATDYVVDYGRMFLTGRSPYPETGLYSANCGITYYRLGVPKPAKGIEVSVADDNMEGRDCAQRSYCYTYTNLFGEEGAPSAVSRHITVKDGTAVTLSGFDSPDETYGVTAVNIYRTATAITDGEVSESLKAMQTVFLFVATIPVGQTQFTDTVLEKDLGIALTTDDDREPPADMRNISYLKGTGILAGVTDNMVHFSKAYQPHNFPAENDLTLPVNIVNTVAFGSILFVTTDGNPYVIDSTKACEENQCRPVEDTNISLPDISCRHAHSAIATPYGCVYSSKDGLVLLQPDSNVELITAPYFSADDWAKLRPDTVRLAFWRGYIICVTDVISFMIEFSNKMYGDNALGAMTTISDKPIDLLASNTDELIFMEDGYLWHWNAGGTYRKYVWESRPINFGGESSPNSVKVKSNNTTFRLIADEINSETLYERRIISDKPVRLARLGRHYNYKIGLTGTGTVDYVDFGTMFTTINAGR